MGAGAIKSSTAAEDVFFNAASNALNNYGILMKGEIRDEFLDDDDLLKCHDSAKSEAMKKFKQFQRRPKDKFQKHKNELENDIQSKLNDFKHSNSKLKKRAEDEATHAINSAKEAYEKTMDELLSGGYVEEAEFKKRSETGKVKAKAGCREKCKRFPSKVEQLEIDLDHLYSVKWNENKNAKGLIKKTLDIGAEAANVVLVEAPGRIIQGVFNLLSQ